MLNTEIKVGGIYNYKLIEVYRQNSQGILGPIIITKYKPGHLFPYRAIPVSVILESKVIKIQNSLLLRESEILPIE